MSAARTAGTVAAVIAAMAVGRLVTDHVPVGETAAQPFVREAGVDETVRAEYGSVTAYDVRAADFLVGIDPIAARGTFVVVDVEARGRSRSGSLGWIRLTSPAGTVYEPTSRGTACGRTVWLETGLTTYVRLCFDVPPDELEGLHLELGRGGKVISGGNARDEVIDIDLGIDAADEERLAADRVTLAGTPVETTDRPDPTPRPEPSGAPEEES